MEDVAFKQAMWHKLVMLNFSKEKICLMELELQHVNKSDK